MDCRLTAPPLLLFARTGSALNLDIFTCNSSSAVCQADGCDGLHCCAGALGEALLCAEVGDGLAVPTDATLQYCTALNSIVTTTATATSCACCCSWIWRSSDAVQSKALQRCGVLVLHRGHHRSEASSHRSVRACTQHEALAIAHDCCRAPHSAVLQRVLEQLLAVEALETVAP